MQGFFVATVTILSVVLVAHVMTRPDWDVTVVVMIRDEAHILRRFFQSVYRLTNQVILCDTGSKDGTRDFWDNHMTFHHNWTDDFALNRNQCLRDALPHVKTKYVLLLDADHTIVAKGLQEPTFQVNLVNFGTSRLPYLVVTKTLKQCHYRGVTHEYLDCPLTATQGAYNGIRLHHFEDGTHRKHKYERDLARLQRAFKVEKNPILLRRYAFYLARTLEDMRNYTHAVPWYRKRAQMTQDQESWFSEYRIGVILLHLNQTQTGVEHLIKAYKMNPHRKEPLYYLARFESKRQNWAECLLYGRAGMLVGSPSLHDLFVSDEIYNWALEEEVAWCLSRSGRHEEATGHYERIKRFTSSSCLWLKQYSSTGRTTTSC